MRVLQLVLFALQLLLSHYCTQSQRSKELISDGSGHISNVERHLGSGNVATYKKGRKRYLLRRKRMDKWCASQMKAMDIDIKVEWKKIIGATVFVLGFVHLLYFYLCNLNERML